MKNNELNVIKKKNEYKDTKYMLNEINECPAKSEEYMPFFTLKKFM